MKIPSFRRIIAISRPRFWLYEFGTFLGIGVMSGLVYGSTDFLSWFIILLWGVYFLISANILIYGINDIYDYATDVLNPKKGTYEALVPPEEAKGVWLWVVATNVPFLFLIPFTQAKALYALGLFIFFAVFYSAKPIRAKVRPFFDAFFSAGHYVATGVFGYFLVGGEIFPLFGVLSGMFWAMAMHAYSAVPDIKADTEAGFSTIATKMGHNGTLLFCALLYILSLFCAYQIVPVLPLVWGAVYLFLMILSYRYPDRLFTLYARFPLINALCGMSFSLWLIWRYLYL